MNNTEIKENAMRIISRILEDAAFIFTDLMEDKDKPQLDSWNPQGLSLSFTGCPSGYFRIWAGNEFARYVAANMLGVEVEQEDAPQKGIDALKEILNIIVGNYLTTVYGENTLFELGLPEKVSAEEFSRDYNSTNAIWLQADGNPVLYIVEVDG